MASSRSSSSFLNARAVRFITAFLILACAYLSYFPFIELFEYLGTKFPDKYQHDFGYFLLYYAVVLSLYLLFLSIGCLFGIRLARSRNKEIYIGFIYGSFLCDLAIIAWIVLFIKYIVFQ